MHNPLPYQRSVFDRLFEEYSKGQGEISFEHFVGIVEKLPILLYTILRFQDNVVKANCGEQFWFNRKLEFKNARDRIGVERIKITS